MTEVTFHFNVNDKLAYCCRLLRKALGTGAKLVVAGPEDVLTQLDQDLWTFSATEFVQHCDAGAKESVRRRSALVLTPSMNQAPFREVLLNLGDAVPAGFEQFSRVIEVVDKSDNDRQFARQRWKHYSGCGLKLVKHDLDQKATQ